MPSRSHKTSASARISRVASVPAVANSSHKRKPIIVRRVALKVNAHVEVREEHVFKIRGRNVQFVGGSGARLRSLVKTVPLGVQIPKRFRGVARCERAVVCGLLFYKTRYILFRFPQRLSLSSPQLAYIP